MDARELEEMYRIAQNPDMPQLIEMAKSDPGSVWFRDLSQPTKFPFSLDDIAVGPFCIEEVEGIYNITGYDRERHEPAGIRIVGEAVEVFNYHSSDSWRAPSMGGIRVYIPKEENHHGYSHSTFPPH